LRVIKKKKKKYVPGQDHLPIVAFPSRGVAALEENVVEFVFDVRVQREAFWVDSDWSRTSTPSLNHFFAVYKAWG